MILLAIRGLLMIIRHTTSSLSNTSRKKPFPATRSIPSITSFRNDTRSSACSIVSVSVEVPRMRLASLILLCVSVKFFLTTRLFFIPALLSAAPAYCRPTTTLLGFRSGLLRRRRELTAVLELERESELPHGPQGQVLVAILHSSDPGLALSHLFGELRLSQPQLVASPDHMNRDPHDEFLLRVDLSVFRVLHPSFMQVDPSHSLPHFGLAAL